MNIEASRETDRQITDAAKRERITVGALLERLVNGLENPAYVPSRPELPVWNLGKVGSLRRHDLYDDAD